MTLIRDLQVHEPCLIGIYFCSHPYTTQQIDLTATMLSFLNENYRGLQVIPDLDHVTNRILASLGLL